MEWFKLPKVESNVELFILRPWISKTSKVVKSFDSETIESWKAEPHVQIYYIFKNLQSWSVSNVMMPF